MATTNRKPKSSTVGNPQVSLQKALPPAPDKPRSLLTCAGCAHTRECAKTRGVTEASPSCSAYTCNANELRSLTEDMHTLLVAHANEGGALSRSVLNALGAMFIGISRAQQTLDTYKVPYLLLKPYYIRYTGAGQYVTNYVRAVLVDYQVDSKTRKLVFVDPVHHVAYSICTLGLSKTSVIEEDAWEGFKAGLIEDGKILDPRVKEIHRRLKAKLDVKAAESAADEKRQLAEADGSLDMDLLAALVGGRKDDEKGDVDTVPFVDESAEPVEEFDDDDVEHLPPGIDLIARGEAVPDDATEADDTSKRLGEVTLTESGEEELGDEVDVSALRFD